MKTVFSLGIALVLALAALFTLLACSQAADEEGAGGAEAYSNGGSRTDAAGGDAAGSAAKHDAASDPPPVDPPSEAPPGVLKVDGEACTLGTRGTTTAAGDGWSVGITGFCPSGRSVTLTVYGAAVGAHQTCADGDHGYIEADIGEPDAGDVHLSTVGDGGRCTIDVAPMISKIDVQATVVDAHGVVSHTISYQDN
jgi:hypothetical protein